MSKLFKIGGKTIEHNYPTLIIAEIGQTHNGSLIKAKKLIKLAKKKGADAVKFQTHFADEESTIDDEFRVKNVTQKTSRLEYWRKMEFSQSDWSKLKKIADDNDIIFLSSPFSEKAVDVLKKINVPAYKIASGEVGNLIMLEKILKLNKPILISCGMSKINEISYIINYLKKKSNKICLLQCTSSYPTKTQDLGLGMIQQFKKKYGIPVGFSDHSGDINSGLTSIALNANVLEVHVVNTKKSKGFDTSSSITFEDLELLSNFRDFFYSFKDKKNKKKLNKELNKMRNLFFKSLTLRFNQEKGFKITKNSLTLKKPGKGIKYSQINKIVGKVLKNDKKSNSLLKWSDIE